MDMPEILTAIGLAAGGLVGYTKIVIDQTRMRVMVETLWASRQRGAQSAAARQGLGEFNSPFELNEKGRSMIPDSLKKELRDFALGVGRKLKESLLWAELERRFGERLNHEVVVPAGSHVEGHHDVIIEIALAFCKECLREAVP